MQKISGSNLVCSQLCTFFESRYVLVCTSTYQYKLVYTGMYWYVWLYRNFPQNCRNFPQNYRNFQKPGKCTIRPVIFPPRCIQFRCRRCHDQAWPCESFLGSKIFNTVYLVTAARLTQTSNTVPIQEAHFQSAATQRPASFGRPASRLQRSDLIIQFVLHWF